MVRVLIKITPPVLLWIVFFVVVLKIPYPDSLIKANLVQVSFFFFPLFAAITFSINIFLKNLLLSSSISLLIISLLLLKALDTLNLITGLITVVPIGLLISYFRKNKPVSLTSLSKIPKLHSTRRHKHE